MITSTGELTKMFLFAYETNQRDAEKVVVGDANRFSFQVNPESYKRRFAIQYANLGRKPGDISDAGTYHNTEPETFTVDILFDNSGVIKKESLLNIAVVNPFETDEPEDVTARVETLKNFCYNYQSDPHRPYYIRLCWGDESGFFFGVVNSLEIEYKLFKPDGKPVRALAHLTLSEAEDPLRTDRRRQQQSPDITHAKVFKSGDELSYMTHKVYRNGGYYMDVAAANGLLSFRNIKEGTVLQFPPLK